MTQMGFVARQTCRGLQQGELRVVQLQQHPMISKPGHGECILKALSATLMKVVLTAQCHAGSSAGICKGATCCTNSKVAKQAEEPWGRVSRVVSPDCLSPPSARATSGQQATQDDQMDHAQHTHHAACLCRRQQVDLWGQPGLPGPALVPVLGSVVEGKVEPPGHACSPSMQSSGLQEPLIMMDTGTQTCKHSGHAGHRLLMDGPACRARRCRLQRPSLEVEAPDKPASHRVQLQTAADNCSS